MNTSDRTMLRASERLHESLCRRRQQHEGISLPELSWQELQKSVRQIRAALRRGWNLAAARLTHKLTRDLNHFSERLSALATVLRDRSRHVPPPTSFELFRQIKDLQLEFGDVTCDLQQNQLCVTTEPIELDGVSLGSFDIRLAWHELSARRAYRVVALEANSACSNSAVTHPHVSNEELCEGDGHEAISAALEEGRIYDFFLLVSRVLATYCPDSAYAQLDSWYGLPCTDCGASTHEDYRTYCGSCDDAVCDECLSSCEACSRGLCSSCTTACGDCRQIYCRSCLEECSGCQAEACRACIEDKLCRECKQDQDHETLDNKPEQTPQESISADAHAGSEVQPHSLGQTAVPA